MKIKSKSLLLFYGTGAHSSNTLHPSYSERVGAGKSVDYNRVFTINVLNLTIN
jgi:hypothetical protein